MGYRLKSIVDCGDGNFEVSIVPCSDCVIRIDKSYIGELLQCLPENAFIEPFEIQMKETKKEGIVPGGMLEFEHSIRFSDYQDWIPCNVPFEQNK